MGEGDVRVAERGVVDTPIFDALVRELGRDGGNGRGEGTPERPVADRAEPVPGR